MAHFELPSRSLTSIQEFTQEDEFTFLASIKQHHRVGSFKLIEELVLGSINLGYYDARSHYLIIAIAELLGIPRDLVEIHCECIYDLLLKHQNTSGTGAHGDDPERGRRETRHKIKKYLMIGLASLGGGAVIGVTGGLAAPIVASAFAGVIGAGTVAMSTAAAGFVGSLFGVAGAGLTASKMQKRVGDLEEFAFLSLCPEYEQTSLTITIAVSGWISDEGSQQFARPWRRLRHTKEQYCLCYESKYLLELSRAMDYLLSFVVSYATQEALKYTFLASVMAAIAWPTALISIANIIDNPWDCCLVRSAQAGKHLADVLMSRQQGKRPASLIGFSLGARVIFYCLQELALRKDSEGIVGDVVLLGAPVTAAPDQWRALGRVVSGRIVNGYSSSDWLLKFLYRTSSAAIRVAGLQAIKWQDRRVQNVDLTHLVSGHMDYYKKLTRLLDYVNVRTTMFDDDDDDVESDNSDEQQQQQQSNKKGDKHKGEKHNACDNDAHTQSTGCDSGIERSQSNATNISASLSQMSMATATTTHPRETTCRNSTTNNKQSDELLATQTCRAATPANDARARTETATATSDSNDCRQRTSANACCKDQQQQHRRKQSVADVRRSRSLGRRERPSATESAARLSTATSSSGLQAAANTAGGALWPPHTSTRRHRRRRLRSV